MRRNRLSGADLFAVITQQEGKRPRLTVFETSCGFRLCQLELPADPEAAVRPAAEAIAAAAKRNADPDRIRFLSLTGVRNNLASSFSSEAERLTAKLSAPHPEWNAVWMEREHLIELLQEKRLTGRWANTATASEILHFELNPGETAQSYSIVATLTAPDGTVVFRAEDADADKVLAAVKGFLATPLAEKRKGDPRVEAARFFREAEIARSQNEELTGIKCAFAAHALEPDNQKYLFAVTFDYHVKNIAPFYPFVRATMDHVINLPELSIDYNFLKYMDNIVSLIWNARFSLPPETSRSHLAFLEANRRKFIEAKITQYKLRTPLSQAFLQTGLGMRNWFFSQQEYLLHLQNAWDQTFQLLGQERPETEEEKETWQQMLHLDLYFGRSLFWLQREMPRKELQSWTEQSCRKLRQAGVPELLPLAQQLEANAFLYSRDYTLERAVELYAEYFRLARKHMPVDWVDHDFFDAQQAYPYPGLKQRLDAMKEQSRKPEAAPEAALAAAPEAALAAAPEPVKFPAGVKPESVLGYCYGQPDGALCFLTADTFDYKVNRVRDGAAETIATFPAPLDGRTHNRFWKMQIDAERIIVAESRCVYVGKTGEILKDITGIPFPIKTFWYAGGRIWALGDRDLMSFDLNGNDRNIHFSGTQEAKCPPFLREAPNGVILYGWLERSGKSALLLFSGEAGIHSGFRRIQLETGETQLLLTVPCLDARYWPRFRVTPEAIWVESEYPGMFIHYRYDRDSGDVRESRDALPQELRTVTPVLLEYPGAFCPPPAYAI